MSSKRKPTAGTSRTEDAIVEMDPAFARNVGLSEGSKVRLCARPLHSMFYSYDDDAQVEMYMHPLSC